MRPPRRLRPVPLGVAAWMRPRRRHPPHVVSLAGDAHPQHPAPRACALPSTGRDGGGTIPMAAAGEAGETRMPRRGARGGTAAGVGRGREETRDLHRLSVWSHSARPLPARCGGRPVAIVAGGSGGRTFQAATSGRWAVGDRNDWRRPRRRLPQPWDDSRRDARALCGAAAHRGDGDDGGSSSSPNRVRPDRPRGGRLDAGGRRVRARARQRGTTLWVARRPAPASAPRDVAAPVL